MPDLEKELDDFYAPIIDYLKARLTATMVDHLVKVYLSGDLEMVTWGQTLGGLPIAYEGPPMEQAVKWAKEYAAKLVTKMDDETKRRLAQVVSDAIVNKRGIPGLAKDLRDTFTDMSKYRSRMIARTETNAALSQGSLNRMQDMGIDGKQWYTSDPCEICAANEAEGVIPVDQAFSSGDMAPPAHPNAVFEGYGFFPYGSLQQMLTSRYDGPAITLEAERIENATELSPGNVADGPNGFYGDILREKINSFFNLVIGNRGRRSITIFPRRIQLTIGPNHPVLTRRGFVNAQFLCEGDELLYDIRGKFTASRIKFNLKQVHSIEDIFTATGAIVGYTNIAASSNYFHGDEVFCNGEIKVIRPKWNLLPIRDTNLIKHLGKCSLTGTYANTKHVAGCSSCQFRFNGIFHTPPRNMCCFRIISTHKTSFNGMAFDASTTTELYNIGGVVVKNCVCALAPARLGE